MTSLENRRRPLSGSDAFLAGDFKDHLNQEFFGHYVSRSRSQSRALRSRHGCSVYFTGCMQTKMMFSKNCPTKNETRLFCVSIAPAKRPPLVLSIQAGCPAEIFISRQLNFIAAVTLHWPSAELLGIAPSELQTAQHHQETNRHQPCVDSRQPIWLTRRHQVQAGALLRSLRDSR